MFNFLFILIIALIVSLFIAILFAYYYKDKSDKHKKDIEGYKRRNKHLHEALENAEHNVKIARNEIKKAVEEKKDLEKKAALDILREIYKNEEWE
jgi:uncharacterized membrane protein